MVNQCKNAYKNSNDMDQILTMIEDMDKKCKTMKETFSSAKFTPEEYE